MGAIVIRTRYDEGTESAEVATSDCDGIATEKTGVRSIFKPFTCMENIIRGIHLRSVLRHVRVCICFIFLNQQVLEEGKSYPLHLSPILVVAIKISIHWPKPVSPLLSTRFIIVC